MTTTTGSLEVAAIVAGVSQETIYDERFRRGLYDERSAVHVLTAELAAALGALVRADRCTPPDARLSLLDWGYGTGRITNDIAIDYPHIPYHDQRVTTFDRDLLIVAFDVSSVGLHQGAATLRRHGFAGAPMTTAGGVMGELTRTENGRTVTVRFVHGNEKAEPAATELLLKEAGGPFSATVSWYSALGHIYGEKARRAALEVLGHVTQPRGELVLSVSSLGDLVEAQAEWWDRKQRGDLKGSEVEAAPGDIEVPGDVVYQTELGQQNYYHVFGPELTDLMQHTRTADGQRVRIQGIRGLDDEFESKEAELANYDRVRALNARCLRAGWAEESYRALHTVAAIRAFTDVLPGDPDDQLVGVVP